MRGPQIKSGGVPRISFSRPGPPCAGHTHGCPDKPDHESAGAWRAERAPHHESGIRRGLDLMRDSPGLGGIRRDKVGLTEISGIPQHRFLPEERPSARPTFPSSRTQRAWTLRRAPQHPSHAMPPSRHARTCRDLVRVSAHPYGNPIGYDPFARPPHAAILSRPRRTVHRTMVRRMAGGTEMSRRKPSPSRPYSSPPGRRGRISGAIYALPSATRRGEGE